MCESTCVVTAALRSTASLAAVLATALAASERNPFDPMERAIRRQLSRWRTASIGGMRRDGRSMREYDLSPDLLAVTHVWHRRTMRLFEIAVKGAPEAVFGLCRIECGAPAAQMLERVAAHARDGLRVLAVAQGAGDRANTCLHLRAISCSSCSGLVGLADPLRRDVPKALAECYRGGHARRHDHRRSPGYRARDRDAEPAWTRRRAY